MVRQGGLDKAVLVQGRGGLHGATCAPTNLRNGDDGVVGHVQEQIVEGGRVMEGSVFKGFQSKSFRLLSANHPFPLVYAQVPIQYGAHVRSTSDTTVTRTCLVDASASIL